MNVSVILAHPNKQSYNHAIANSAVTQLQKNWHSVVFHDLYAEKFDPILLLQEIPTEVPLSPDIKQHCCLKSLLKVGGTITVIEGDHGFQ